LNGIKDIASEFKGMNKDSIEDYKLIGYTFKT